jgi:PhnB protein
MLVQPYLNFNGRCEEALTYYRTVLGAEIKMLMRFKEAPEPPKTDMAAPGIENKVLHACFRIGETELMASDGRCQGHQGFQGIMLSISVANEAEADRVFAGLSNGGQVQMPLGKTFFSPRFGMVADRFGVSWMVITAAN